MHCWWECTLVKATVKNSVKIPQKITSRTTIWSSNSATGYLPKENKNTNSKRYLCPCVYCSIVYKSQDMNVTQVSISRGMAEDVIYIHTYTCTNMCIYIYICNKILLSYKKGWNLAICENMDGRRGYYAKWKKSEKDEYHIISLLSGI